MILFEFLFIPLLSLITFIIAYISVSIILSKKTSLGLISNEAPNKIVYLSSKDANIFNAEESWSNRVIYVSLDVEGVQKNTTVILFEADNVAQGTTLTFFNSPSSSASGTLFIVGQNFSAPLGRGQGITVITQRQIFVGIYYSEGNYGAAVEFPETQQILWKPFKLHSPQPTTLCSTFNETGPTSSVTLNTNGCAADYPPTPQDDPDLSVSACASSQCICDVESASKSVWCNI